ncbi:MAG: S53 family peptidase [Actinoallomurus sp.]
MGKKQHLLRKIIVASLGAVAITAGLTTQGLAQPAPAGRAGAAGAVPVRTAAVCGPARPGQMRCLAVAVADAAGRPLAARSPAAFHTHLARGLGSPSLFPGPLGPAELRKAYRLPAAAATTHLAVVDAFDTPTLIPDLTVYAANYGLPAPTVCTTDTQAGCVAVRNQTGAATPLPSNTDSGWGEETALDVETTYGLCPTCRITLYEGNSPSFTDLAQTEDTAARHNTVISNSFGAYRDDCGAKTGGAGYNHPHVAIVVSSGDSGFGVQCPAVLPTVISVGGTTLNLTTTGSYVSESVWGTPASGGFFPHDPGTGSGCSLNPANKAQPWQLKQANWRRTGCKQLRGSNDVAADADPVTGVAVYSSAPGQGLWFQFGGTSLSAPIIAATYALAGNAANQAYPAQSLYTAKATNLHDVTTGTNSSGCPIYLECNAAKGYDLPTGVGTLKGIGAF